MNSSNNGGAERVVFEHNRLPPNAFTCVRKVSTVRPVLAPAGGACREGGRL